MPMRRAYIVVSLMGQAPFRDGVAKMFQTCGSATLWESERTATRVREAIIVQVLHYPYCQGMDTVKLAGRPKVSHAIGAGRAARGVDGPFCWSIATPVSL